MTLSSKRRLGNLLNLFPNRRRRPNSLDDPHPIDAIERLEDRMLLSGTPVITEFMASNSSTLEDVDGDFEDWIELFNPTAQTIDLDGLHLTDNENNLDKWQIPAVQLAPGEHLVIFASGKDRDDPLAELHTDFSLRAEGEYLALVDTDGVTVLQDFGEEYPPQVPDVSFGIGSDADTTTLVNGDDPVSAFVPTSDILGSTWTQPGFDDSAWIQGLGGVGFDTGETEIDTYPAAVSGRGPVGYWRLNETGGTTAENIGSLGNGFNGNYIGNPTLTAPGPRPDPFFGLETENTGVGLVGNSGAVSVGGSILSNRPSFTMMGWIRPVGTQANRTGLFGQNDAIEFGFINATTLQIWTPSGGSLNLAYPFAAEEWHHVAVTGDGSNLRIYLDGTLAGTGGSGTNNYGSSGFPFNIGGNGIFDGSGNFFNGDVDEVAVFHEALSENDIEDIYESGLGEAPPPPPPTASPIAEPPNLLGYWNFDDGTAGDQSGNNVNGTTNGNVSFAASPLGQAATFDNAGDFIQMDNNEVLRETDTVAISVWAMRPVGDNTLGEIFTMGNHYGLRHTASGTLQFYFDNNPASNSAITISTPNAPGEILPADGQFHHVLAQKTETGTEIWVDGVKTSAEANTTDPIDYNQGNQTFYIGRYYTGLSFFDYNGQIDDLTIYQDALTPDLISALASGITPGQLADGINFNPETIVNGDFELPGVDKEVTLNNVPGWDSDQDIANDMVGVENTFGSWHSFQNNATSMYQLLDTVVEADTSYQLTFDGRITAGSATEVIARFYYLNGPQRTEIITKTIPLNNADWTRDITSLNFTAQEGEPWVGQQLGIEFIAPVAWVGIDNVRVGSGSYINNGGGGAGGGQGVVGLFEPFVNTDIETEMLNVNSSAYVRYEFNVTDPGNFNQLLLRAQYDDGFVAYLNGIEVVRRNAPTAVEDPPEALPFNASSVTRRSDEQAIIPQVIDISDSLGALQAGSNVLAIHALNDSAEGPDLLVRMQLDANILTLNTDGQLYYTNPTPGEANVAGEDELGPLIRHVSQPETQPNSLDDIIITATVDESFDTIDTVNLTYRVMFGAEVSIEMVDDGTGNDAEAGDGIYTATIPAQTAQPGQMLRWYVTADDVSGGSSRAPLFALQSGKKQSAEYFGTVIADSGIDTDLPIYYWFSQDTNAARTRGGTRASVFYLGEFYDNIFVRIRGGSTTGAAIPSYKFEFNRGEKFRFAAGEPRVTEFNLNTNLTDKAQIRQALAYEIHNTIGAPGPDSFLMRVQRNDAFYSISTFIENPDDDMLDRLGLDPDGAFYKGTSVGSFSNNQLGYEKKTRTDEGNDDLRALNNAVNQLSGTALTNYLFDNIDVPGMLNYLVGTVITHQNDNPHKNHFLYRDTEGTGEWLYLPWDHDLTIGSNWVGTSFSDTIYADDDSVPGKGSQIQPSHPLINSSGHREWNNHWNVLMHVMLNDPVIGDMYLRRLRTVMEQYLDEPGTPVQDRYLDNRIDEMLSQMSNQDRTLMQNLYSWGQRQTIQQAADIIKTQYLEVRRVHLFETHNVDNLAYGNRANIPNSQPAAPNITFGNLEFNPSSGDQDQEYIEIINPHNTPIDISGWEVQGGIEMEFRLGTVIPANASLYITPDSKAFRARTTGPAGGQGLFVQGGYKGHLSNFGETMTLHNPEGQIVDTLTYEGAPSDAQQYLRITEMNFNPADPTNDERTIDNTLNNDDFEFIEFTNTSDTITLDLTDISFADGIIFTFPAMNLAPGQSTLIVRNQTAFDIRYNTAGLNIAGQYDGALDNGGEDVKLDDSNGSTILDFEYDDGRKWPIEADGHGASIEIIDTTLSYSDADNWRASYETNGTPGAIGIGAEVNVLLIPRIDPTLLQINPNAPDTDLPSVIGGEIDDFYVREDTPYFIEVWLKSDQLAGDGPAITGGSLTLEFDPTIATPLSIDFADTFSENQSQTSDLIEGTFTFAADTLATDLGDDEHILFARILFSSQNNIDPLAQQFDAVDTDLDRAAIPYAFTTTTLGPVPTNFQPLTPDIDSRAVIFDFDNNNIVNFADLAFFLPALNEPAGGSEPPYAVWADFDNNDTVNQTDLDALIAAFAKPFADIAIPASARTEGTPPPPDPQSGINLLNEAEAI